MVLKNYRQAIMDEVEMIMSETTFNRLWEILTPGVHVMTPRTDLCELCQRYKFDISHTHGDAKQRFEKQYLEHRQQAAKEREYYRSRSSSL